MIKKILLYILLLFFLFSPLFSFASTSTVARFPQLGNPKNLIVDGNQLIITDYPYIYLFSLEDYSLLKKFGSRGMGPGEFYIDKEDLALKATGLLTVVHSDRIVVSSMGRLSFFNRCGEFLKMISKNRYRGARKLIPLGNRFVGFQLDRGKGDKLSAVLSIYDENLKKGKEIFRCDFWMPKIRGDFNFFRRTVDSILFKVYDDTLFTTEGGVDKFLIDVFDSNGKKRYSIQRDYEKIKVTEGFIKRVHNYYRLKFKRGLEYNLKHTKFPDYFPAIRHFTISDKKIYVITHKKSGDNSEIIVLDLQGNLLKKVMVPVKEKNVEYLYPYSIHAGKLYQIVENEESEEWELHVTEI
jgi:hypothetical protein